MGRTKGLVDVIRKFREKFEVSDEAQGGRVKLVGDDTTAREGRRERLRPIVELAREEIGKMASVGMGLCGCGIY